MHARCVFIRPMCLYGCLFTSVLSSFLLLLFTGQPVTVHKLFHPQTFLTFLLHIIVLIPSVYNTTQTNSNPYQKTLHLLGYAVCLWNCFNVCRFFLLFSLLLVLLLQITPQRRRFDGKRKEFFCFFFNSYCFVRRC